MQDTAALNISSNVIHPRATENIPEIIDFVKTLVDKGYAYDVDGDVYFRARKFKSYGALPHINVDQLEIGASQHVNPEEMAKNLNTNGGYIPGVRPGDATISYVSNVLSKLTIVGSIFLVLIAALPIVFTKFSGLSSSVTIGGTGLLIVVGVAIETFKQIESSLVSRNHRYGVKR